MPVNETFTDLIVRLRRGDAEAAATLVRQYEPQIRREVRTWLRLRQPRLSRLVDSLDISQSVLASFFVRTAAGQYDLDQPEQLVKLLGAMARNKLAEQVRYHQAQSRDIRRVAPLDREALEVAAPHATPSQQVAGRELFEVFRTRLTEEERRLADRRAQGHGWPEIAAELGGTADGRRMQLARAADRVSQELGLECSDA
jgi:hypothetical protein